jgi:hypothetical protein
MDLIIIIIILLLVFGGGGGWYGYHSGWYGPRAAGTPAGPGFNPMAIVWMLVIIILLVWLLRELHIVRF